MRHPEAPPAALRRRAAPTAALAAIALALAAACARPRDVPNVLLVVVDTMRADRLSSAGFERETTPHLDALAAEGLRFTHAQSPRSKTTPAVASLLTGLYPHDHGVRDLTQSLPHDAPSSPSASATPVTRPSRSSATTSCRATSPRSTVASTAGSRSFPTGWGCRPTASPSAGPRR